MANNSKTTIWIATHPQWFKVCATLLPTMLQDCRSRDLDDTVWTNSSNLRLSIYELDMPLLQSTVAISFATLNFEVLKSQAPRYPVLWSSRVNDLLPPVSLNLWLGFPLQLRPSRITNLKSSPLLTGYLPEWKICWHVFFPIDDYASTSRLWPPQPDQRSYDSFDQRPRSSPSLRALPPLLSFGVLDLASHVLLRIDSSHRFGFPSFRNLKCQTLPPSNDFYPGTIIC